MASLGFLAIITTFGVPCCINSSVNALQFMIQSYIHALNTSLLAGDCIGPLLKHYPVLPPFGRPELAGWYLESSPLPAHQRYNLAGVRVHPERARPRAHYHHAAGGMRLVPRAAEELVKVSVAGVRIAVSFTVDLLW